MRFMRAGTEIHSQIVYVYAYSCSWATTTATKTTTSTPTTTPPSTPSTRTRPAGTIDNFRMCRPNCERRRVYADAHGNERQLRRRKPATLSCVMASRSNSSVNGTEWVGRGSDNLWKLATCPNVSALICGRTWLEFRGNTDAISIEEPALRGELI